MLMQTIQAFKAVAKDVDFHYIICDDNSPDMRHMDAARNELAGTSFEILTSGGSGVGRSKNVGITAAFKLSDVYLLTEDDWVTTRNDLKFQLYMNVLNEHPETGMIRLGYLGGDDLKASLVNYNDHTFWHVFEGQYAYSGQISMRHRRWQDTVGWHTEKIAPGTEELDMCYRYAQTEDKPQILFPAEYPVTFNHGPFRTIGDFSTNSGR